MCPCWQAGSQASVFDAHLTREDALEDGVAVYPYDFEETVEEISVYCLVCALVLQMTVEHVLALYLLRMR